MNTFVLAALLLSVVVAGKTLFYNSQGMFQMPLSVLSYFENINT